MISITHPFVSAQVRLAVFEVAAQFAELVGLGAARLLVSKVV
jgi:hypothetical protein